MNLFNWKHRKSCLSYVLQVNKRKNYSCSDKDICERIGASPRFGHLLRNGYKNVHISPLKRARWHFESCNISSLLAVLQVFFCFFFWRANWPFRKFFKYTCKQSAREKYLCKHSAKLSIRYQKSVKKFETPLLPNQLSLDMTFL